jgi:LacI family transcriptional regulator
MLHFCHRIGIGVPEQLAILGVDVDVPERTLSRPHLAAVDQAPRRMGYEAGQLLTRLMDGALGPSEPIVVPPLQVLPGGSADLLVCSTPWVAKAMRFILDSVEASITVADVARHVKKSRRSLELAFKRDLSRTVAQEMTHERIEKAKRLLALTGLTMPEVAVRCGFEWATSLTHCFKRVTGKTPNQYRHDHGTP